MKTKIMFRCIFVFVIALLSACESADTPSPEPPTADPLPETAVVNPEEIVQSLGEALNGGDVDAAMALIAEDAVFQMNFFDETLNGADEFRALFTDLVAGHFRIELTAQAVDGGTVTTETKTWGDGIPDGGPNVATEVYVIANGKIASITWTPNDETIAKLMAEMEAEAAPEQMIVTFNGDQCIYNGPDTVPAGQITIVLDVEDQTDYEEYGLAVVTLDEDKTFADIDEWPSTDQPPWTRLHTLIEEVPQGSRSEKSLNVITSHGPLYLVCFTAYPVAKTDVVGPINVVVPMEEAIIGVWQNGDGPGDSRYHVYTEDGRYCAGTYLPALFKDYTKCYGYEFDGSILTELCLEESIGCTEEVLCQVEIVMLDDNHFEFWVPEPCPMYNFQLDSGFYGVPHLFERIEKLDET